MPFYSIVKRCGMQDFFYLNKYKGNKVQDLCKIGLHSAEKERQIVCSHFYSGR